MILVIGHLGNMGRRYTAILDYLKEPWYGIDTQSQPWDYSRIKACDRAIIATPTETHYEWCMKLQVPFLCEKPITKDIRQASEIYQRCKKDGIDGRMVCNWQYALNTVLQREGALSVPGRKGAGDVAVIGQMDINYDCYNTGKDGLAWDCIQLIYMADLKKLKLDNKMPVLDVEINGHRITRDLIDESYILMISQWLFGGGLWDMKDAMEATRKVYEYLDLHTS